MVAKGEIGRAVELSVPIGARHFGRSPERPMATAAPTWMASIQCMRSPHARFPAVAQLPLVAELRR
jgi:hypothetical protein